jgi:hypothetical protein
VKDAGATGAVRAARVSVRANEREVGGSTHRDRGDRSPGHKTLLSLVHRAAEGPTVLRQRQEGLRRGGGVPVCRGLTRQRDTATGRH